MSAGSEIHRAPVVRRYDHWTLEYAAADAGSTAVTWQVLAELLDELVTEYDQHLESGFNVRSAGASAAALREVLDGFDVAAAVARRNADVLDDLATEITIAQARMQAIRNELETERAVRPRHGSVPLERAYTARADREVWRPLDGDVAAARDRLQIVRGEG